MWHEVSPIPIKRRVKFAKGRAYIDGRTKADMKRVWDSWDGPCYECPVEVIVHVYEQLPKTKKDPEPFTVKPDIDNILKAVMDGLNGRAYRDDKLIVHAECWKHDRSDEIVGEFVLYDVKPLEGVE